MRYMTRKSCLGVSQAHRPSRHFPGAHAALLTLLLGGWPLAGAAAVSLLQPPRVVDGTRPLQLTLLLRADQGSRLYAIPDTLEVMAAGEMQAPQTLTLRRNGGGAATLRLRQGESHTVDYAAAWPSTLRGQVRLDVVGVDAAPVLVTLNQASQPDERAGPAAAAAGPTAPATAAPMPVVAQGAPAPTPADLRDNARLSVHEPMYLLLGAHDGANAKFQLSFKYRIFEGKDPASRRLLDNLYFAYTQTSIWDLSQPSAPFRDTSYRPSVFYYLSDTGVKGPLLSRLSLATGLEHESNGRDGAQSRSINTVFVTPTFFLGDQAAWHWRVAPKLYYYLEKSDNADIGRYRGYMDLHLAYGKPDDWELAAILRKGTRSDYGSLEARATYPLARLIPGTAGYLMAQYFIGYGEDLLDYNRRSPWQFRIGYALSR
nr:phospholipase A [Cupriavidus sp. USMAHM13]